MSDLFELMRSISSELLLEIVIRLAILLLLGETYIRLWIYNGLVITPLSRLVLILMAILTQLILLLFCYPLIPPVLWILIMIIWLCMLMPNGWVITCRNLRCTELQYLIITWCVNQHVRIRTRRFRSGELPC